MKKTHHDFKTRPGEHDPFSPALPFPDKLPRVREAHPLIYRLKHGRFYFNNMSDAAMVLDVSPAVVFNHIFRQQPREILGGVISINRRTEKTVMKKAVSLRLNKPRKKIPKVPAKEWHEDLAAPDVEVEFSPRPVPEPLQLAEKLPEPEKSPAELRLIKILKSK
jgi:hypothetical protein